MKRFDLSDKEFALIKDVASYKPARGPEPRQIREMLDGILFVLCTGIPWRCLPDGFPPWRSVYARFRAYQKLGIFEQILAVLQKTASTRRQIHLTLICVDGSYIRAHRHAAGAVKKTTTKDKRLVAHVEDSPPKST